MKNDIPFLLCGDEEEILPFAFALETGLGDIFPPPFNDFALSYRLKQLRQNSIARREQKLTESYLRTLINNLAFDFWVMDENRRYSLQNDHSISQWGNCTGKKIEDLSLPEELEAIWKEQTNRCFTGEMVRSEYPSSRDGKEWFLESTISPVIVNQAIKGIIGITRDISSFKETENKLKEQKQALEEANIALKVILKTKEEANQEIEEKIRLNLQSLVLPLLESLQQTASSTQSLILEEIRTNIEQVCAPFTKTLQGYQLSPTELQIAKLISHGKTTKEIADFLHVAPSTINSHRNSIRKKTGIKNNQLTLKTFLSSLN